MLAAQALLDQAEINLGYTEVRSPIDGRIGIAIFTVGNLVGPSSGTLATIVREDPVYVIFQPSERDVINFKRRFIEPGVNVLLNPLTTNVIISIYRAPFRMRHAHGQLPIWLRFLKTIHRYCLGIS